MALTNLSQITTSGISTLTDVNLNYISGIAATFTGNVTVGGTLTYDDVTNVDSVGLITARSGIIVSTGTATTALVVNGNARITGILTVGSSSLTFDGTNNVVNVGTALTLGHTQGLQFHTQNLHSQGFEINNVNATGIVTATTFIGNLTGNSTGNLTGNVTGNVTGDVTGTASNASGATSDFSIADKIVHTGDTNTAIRFPADDTVTIETAGTEKLRIKPDGRIGIGTIEMQDNGHFQHYTSVVRHQSFQSNTGDLAIVTDNNSNPAVYIKGTGTADLLNVFDNTTEVFTIKDGGNVGIGLTNPVNTLHVLGAGTVARLQSSTSTSALRFHNSAANDGYVKYISQDLTFTTADTEKLRITSDGVLSLKNGSPPAWATDTGYVNATFGSSGYLRSDTDVNSNFLSIGSNAYRHTDGWKHTNAGWATQLQTTANSGDLTYSVSTTSGSADGTVSWSEKVRITGAGDITASNTQFTTHVHQEYTGFTDGSTVVNYLLVCPTTNTNIRFVGTIMTGRHGGATGVGGGMIDVALIGSSTGVADKVDYNIRSMSTHGSYAGPQGQWCTIDFGGTTYFAIRFSSSGGDMWGATPQHCSFNGYINNCTPVGKNTTNDTLTNETILTDTKGRNTFQNTKIGVDTVSPYYKLDVRFNNADTALSGGTSGDWSGDGLRLQNNNTTAGSMSLLHFRSGNSADWHIGTKYVSSNNSDIVFLQEGVNEKLRIKNNGDVEFRGPDTSRVTIAYASNYARLDWRGTNVAASEHYILSYGTGHASADDFHMVNKVGDLIFRTGSTTAERLNITSGGNIGINTTGGSGKLEIGQSTGNIAFRIRNTSSNAGNNKFQIYPRSSGDGDYLTMVYYHPDNYPTFASNYSGTWMAYASVYAGRTRSNSASPTNYYRHGAHGFNAYSARTDNQNAYRSNIYIRAWDANDHGDRNIIAYADSGSDTDTANSTSDLRFGVKADGAVQGQARFFSGRVESDAATPTSVYGTGRGGIYGYDNSSTAVVYLLAEAGGSSSTYFTFARTSDSDTQWKHRTSDGRMYVDASATTFSGADYAEYFEWSDGNPNNEDRAGYTVVLKDGNKIGIATSGDSPSSIIGSISGAPAIIGDGHDLSWRGKWKKDNFGREETTPVQYLVWNQGYEEDENGNKVPVKQPDQTYQTSMEGSDHQMEVGSKLDAAIAAGSVPQYAIDNNIIMNATRRVKDPLYDETKKYVSREFRQEWSPVGLVGKLVIYKGQVMGDRWIKMKDINEELEQWLVR